MTAALTYRIARKDDYYLLIQFRKECGWGVGTLADGWTNPDRIYCVFEYGGEDAGMACWVLEKEDYPEEASRSTGSVLIASLFVRKKFQGLGIGRRAMDILEREAVERYNAQWITLDTAAYDGEDRGGYWYEDFNKPGRTIAWYQQRGYERYKENKPTVPHISPLPDNPNRLLSSAFLRKSRSSVLGKEVDERS